MRCDTLYLKSESVGLQTMFRNIKIEGLELVLDLLLMRGERISVQLSCTYEKLLQRIL